MLAHWPDDRAPTVRLWSLTDDALVEEIDGAGVTVVTRWGEHPFPGAGAVVVESLRRMAFGPVALSNCLPPAADGTGPDPAAAAEMERVLVRVAGAVVHSLALPDGRPLLSVEPLLAAAVFDPVPVSEGVPVRLSHFATLRAAAGQLVLEVPGRPFRVLLVQAQVRALATALVAPAVPADLAAGAGLAAGVVREVLAFLVAAGAALVASAAGSFAEDDDPDLAGWAHHELHFHEHSRTRAGAVPGAPPAGLPPVTRPLPRGSRFPLPGPDPAGPASGATLRELLECDHTGPALGDGALTVEQLGELLHRSARIRSTGRAHLRGRPDHDASQRPYTTVARLYELELYLTLDRCTGLPRGVFHYDPLGHLLTLLDARPEHVDRLLDVGRVGAGSRRPPAALLTVTARTGRVSWIRPGSGYGLALVHCGAFQQTLHLVARAMGLAAHAIPSDAHGVDELLGLPWPAEVGLGECVIDAPGPPGGAAEESRGDSALVER